MKKVRLTVVMSRRSAPRAAGESAPGVQGTEARLHDYRAAANVQRFAMLARLRPAPPGFHPRLTTLQGTRRARSLQAAPRKAFPSNFDENRAR